MIRALVFNSRLKGLLVPPAKLINNPAVYGFGSSERNTHKQASQQKSTRQIEIEHRKKIMEEHQIRIMQDKIENTKGNFNPFIAYLKLYRSFFMKLAVILGLAMVGGLCLRMVGIHKDPFTGKKKILLISDDFQKSMDDYLRKIVVNQLCLGYSGQKLSSTIQQKGIELQSWLREKTGKIYRIVIIPCQQHVITVLPETIIISKNMFFSKGNPKEDLKLLLLLMESLFAKKFHITDLAINNVMTFGLGRIKASPISDIKLTSIYTRKYSEEQIKQTIIGMSQKYQTGVKQLRESLKIILQSFDRISRQRSIFSIANRLQSSLIYPLRTEM